MWKKDKYEFAQKHITFLRYKIREGLIKMDKAKVQVIKDWHALSKMTKLKSFLELANYYWT